MHHSLRFAVLLKRHWSTVMKKKTFLLAASLAAFICLVTFLVGFHAWRGDKGAKEPDEQPIFLEQTQYRWIDGAIGLVKRAHGIQCWRDLALLHGDGALCVFHSEELLEGSTGGYYFTLSAQLPPEPKVGDTLLLTAVAVGGGDTCEFRSMTVGEATLVEFRNPIPWLMPSVKENNAIGRIEIIEVTNEDVLVEIEISAILVDWPNETGSRRFVVNEAVRFKREIASSALL